MSIVCVVCFIHNVIVSVVVKLKNTSIMIYFLILVFCLFLTSICDKDVSLSQPQSYFCTSLEVRNSF